ncbi:hypothetical protein [Cytobacillus firmus]|uniref:hypothetical protein n=1 Tax=Cytobacillus firmus TaxID=1399 RepID=UPI00202F6B06|nr:hypothetical protein [Cytobacillus firmus]URT71588.1 hypothetical protein NAF01_03710 [Cytobacillus firmus]
MIALLQYEAKYFSFSANGTGISFNQSKYLIIVKLEPTFLGNRCRAAMPAFF